MWISLGMVEWCKPFWFTLTLTLTTDHFLVVLCLELISYITNNFPQMSFMLDNKICYMTHITYLLSLAETSFHWLRHILMSNSDELNLVKTGKHQDFSVLTDSQNRLN